MLGCIQMNGGLEVTIFSSNYERNQVSNQVGNQVPKSKAPDFSTLIDRITKLFGEEIKKPTETSLRKYAEEAKNLDKSTIRILEYCQQPRKRKEILEDCLRLSNQTKNYKTHIEPMVQKEILQLTIKDKPKSQHQKYFITQKGKVILYICQNEHGEV